MSMSVEQRRTVVLEQQTFPAGRVRIAKASNKYDRRLRHLVVEWCPARFVGHEFEELSYVVIQDFWPIRTHTEEAWAAYRTAWLTVLAMSR